MSKCERCPLAPTCAVWNVKGYPPPKEGCPVGDEDA